MYSDPDGTLILGSSIVANNSGPYSSNGIDIDGSVQSADYNLIERVNGATITGPQGHHVPAGTDPAIGSLADNGGGTLTHALQSGSAAIDAGTCQDGGGSVISADQRGRIRPQGLSCDIGAYESPGPHLSIEKSTESALVKASEVITYSLIVRNLGDGVAEGATVSDTLPSGLALAGAVDLAPESAGTLGTLPAVVTGLTVGAEESVTVTLPVTVEAGLETGTTITNTAAVTDWGGNGPSTDSDTIVVTSDTHTVFIPLLLRAAP